jgi:transposase-like protein
MPREKRDAPYAENMGSSTPTGQIDDSLTEVPRAAGRQLLEQAVEAELKAFRAAYADPETEGGRQRLVRHGHGPERNVLTGIGSVPVRRAKARDRGATSGDDRIRFTSNVLPRFARRTRSLDAVLPVPYLRGPSSGAFQEALTALTGKRAPALSAQVLGRLKADWKGDYERWQQRDLTGRSCVYLRADGLHLPPARAHGERATEHPGTDRRDRRRPQGVGGLPGGFRESARNWRELLADLTGRGLTVAPKLAVGDGLPEGPERGVSQRRPRNRKPRFGIWTVLEGPGTRQAPEPMVSVGSDNANSP